MYGSEVWSITSDIKKCLQSCEIGLLRKMMKIPSTDKVCNDDVLSRALVKRKLTNDMSQATVSLVTSYKKIVWKTWL